MNIPNSVTSIGERAFYYCTSLTSVTIPDSVTSIGKEAFYSCTSLKDIYYAGTEEQWKKISKGYDWNYGCPATIHFNSSAPAYTIASGELSTGIKWDLSSDGTLTVTGSGAMPDFTYESRAPWFSYADSIKSVVIGEGITSIGDLAFYRCAFITSISFSKTVTKIGSYAFSDCTSLTIVRLTVNITIIDVYAFYNCTSLETVEFPSGTAGTSGTQPRLTKIADYAFCGCVKLKYVYIPYGVTTIGNYAFSNCTSLINVQFPTTLTEIGAHAFENCVSITYIDITINILIIRYHAFYGCTALTSVKFPSGTKVISDHVLANCTSLTNIYIPDSVIKIEDGAFENCTALTNITIPKNVEEIGDGILDGCSSLESVFGSSESAASKYAEKEGIAYVEIDKQESADNRLILFIGSHVANAYGKEVYNDVAPIIELDRTMLPPRFIAENMDAEVKWDEEKRLD